jgi:APA family basic amino acid/polyamine antiporter
MNSESANSQNEDDSFEHMDKPRKSKFKPVFTLTSLILLGFGNTIGSGVFSLTGVAAKMAGPAVFLGFIIAGIIALLTAMVYAEFAAIIPKSGSAYIYTYTTFGELPAWVVGWN